MLKKPAKNLELESLIQKTAADLALLFTRQDDRGIGPWHFHIDAIAGDWISDTLERYGLTRGDVDHRQLAVSDKQAQEMERWKNDKERALEQQDSERQTSVDALYKLRVGEGPGYHDPHCGREGEVGGSDPREECAPGGDVEAGSERIVHRDPESKQLRLSFGDEAKRQSFWGGIDSVQRKIEEAADEDIKLDRVINQYVYNSMVRGLIISPDRKISFDITEDVFQNIDLENMTPRQESLIRGLWIAGNILDLEMGHAGLRTSDLDEYDFGALDQLREIRDLYDPKPLMQKEMYAWDDDIKEVANDYMDAGADDFERWQIFNAIKGHPLGRPIVTQQYAQEFLEVGEWTQEVGGPGVRPEFLAVVMEDAQRYGDLSEEVALQIVDVYTERANKYGTLENTYALYHNRRGGIKSYIFTHIDNMLPGQWIPPDEREEIRNTADLLNEGWAISTQDLGGVALSEAVADIYGGESIPRENNNVINGERDISKAVLEYMKIDKPDYPYSAGELAQDFLDSDEVETESREWVQTMYERTQEYFKYYDLNPGDTVRLYRGMNTLANPAWNPNGDEGPAVVEMWAASSWTTDIETARRFANGTGTGKDTPTVDGAIVVSDVPIERILSTPQTGFGCKHETEFIVLGQDGIEATVYNETARSDDDIELMLDFWTGSRERELAISDEAYQKLEEVYANKSSVVRGGPGSGHHGHEGRPGEVGGSAPSGGHGVAEADAPYGSFISEQKRLVEYAKENWKEVKNLPPLAWMTPDGTMYSIKEAGYRHDESAGLALGGAGVWDKETMASIYEGGIVTWGSGEAQKELMEYDFVRVMTTPLEFAFAFISPQRLTREARDSLAVQVLLAKKRGLKVLGQPWGPGLPNWYEHDDLLDILNIRSLIDRGGPGSGHHGHEGRPGEVGGSAPSNERPAPTGRCFETSAKWIMNEAESLGDDVRLVHGTVAGQLNLEGVRFAHSWAEFGGMVYDSEKEILVRKERYYDVGDVKDTVEYTPTELRINLIKYGHWGPWDERFDVFRRVERGGPGSGHHGHAGRPGEVGGSAPSQVNFGWNSFREANSWGTRRNRAVDLDEADPTGSGLASVRFYVNFGFIQLNDWLRKGKKDYSDLALEDNKNTMAGLDQLLSHYPLEENIVTYRGVSEDFFKRLKPDKVFRDKGYISTTLVEKRLSPGFHKGEIGFHATLEIHVPKGVHGYYVGGGYGPTNEYELLLERGLRFQVEEIHEIGPRAVLKVVPNE